LFVGAEREIRFCQSDWKEKDNNAVKRIALKSLSATATKAAADERQAN
jgi:hypothetical protein